MARFAFIILGLLAACCFGYGEYQITSANHALREPGTVADVPKLTAQKAQGWQLIYLAGGVAVLAAAFGVAAEIHAQLVGIRLEAKARRLLDQSGR